MRRTFSNPYKAWFFIILLILITVVTAWLVSWQRQQPKVVTGYGQGFTTFRQQMRFDTVQTADYNQFLRNYQNQIAPYKRELWELQEASLELISQEQADSTQLIALSQKMAEVQHQIRMETYRHLNKVQEISSPEQQQILHWLYRELLLENKARYGMQQGPAYKNRGRHRHGRR